MSMRDYAVDDYGLVLDDETIKVIASKVFDEFAENDEETCDWGYELYEKGVCEYICEFTGEAQMIADEGYSLWSCEYNSYNYDNIFYVPLTYYPMLFKRAYSNMEEIIEEFKNKIGEYLPKDFDYRSRICHITGTYYG